MNPVCLALAAAATTSLSSVAGAAPQANEPQLLDLDGTVFVMLGLFLLTMFVLTHWLWRPYLRVREQRGERVTGLRDKAARLEADAAARLAKVEAQLAEARRAAGLERARARAEAQSREQTIVAQATAAAQRALAESRAKIDASLAAEKANIEKRATDLGTQIGERVLGRMA
jgi:F-type H+-transporting ATPase subunit b